MSGGVDSSVAALLMREKGYEVTGITMKLYSENENSDNCGSQGDIKIAAEVCEKLQMEHIVCEYSKEFQNNVIDKFIDEYKKGATPNPCIECNKSLKFKKLIEIAEEKEYDCFVTGHYARVEFDESRGLYFLKKGLDESKDQSYVLYFLNQEQLKKLCFPLGTYTKHEIRGIAEKYGLQNANKPDSQDICFVKDNDYAGFIERATGEIFKKGSFVDVNGKFLGEHQGIIRYTVGQRKGLGISFNKPMFVYGKNAEKNEVMLCGKDRLFSKTLTSKDVSFTSYIPEDSFKAKAKIRYNQKEQDCYVKLLDNSRALIEFDEPQRAITPGQAVVIYDSDIVLGGGTIE